MTSSAGERRAWGWVGHLREGGTTRWRDWTVESEPAGRVLPGVQQLGLLRRLNLAGRPDAVLVDRVLGASAPGRGRPDLELAGVAARSRFGPPPVRPSDLPDSELTRVASGLLAEDLVAAGAPEPPRPLFVRPWRTRYRLVGDPWLADPARAALVARGRPPGGRGFVVLVLGADVGTLVTDAWISRAFDEGGQPWPEWLALRVAAPGLPARVDLVRTARAWAQRVGTTRVHLVLDPAAVPALVGTRRPLPSPPEVSADGAEVARWVAVALGLLVDPERRRELLRSTLLPRLVREPGPPLVVPEELQPWLQRRARRLHDAVLAAGYPVHGAGEQGHQGLAAALQPAPRAGVESADDGRVLDLACRLLLDGVR